jgi:hypothetical protein
MVAERFYLDGKYPLRGECGALLPLMVLKVQIWL